MRQLLLGLLFVALGQISEGSSAPNYAGGGIARHVPKSVHVNVQSYGAVGDGQAVADCSTTSGSAVVTCTSSHFLRGDVGKVIVIWQAGPSSGNYQTPLSTTIRSYQSGTQVTLGLAASQTHHPAPRTAWGTNNQTAVANAIANSACAKASASDLSGCVLYFPRGHYMLQTVEFPCGAIGTFGSFTCTTMASNVTIAGDSTTASTIEEWDGNITDTVCSAYTYNCGLVFFGQKSTKDGALSDAAHYVNGVSIHDISLIMAPFMPGTYFKQAENISLGGTMNAEVYNTFVEGSSYLCIGGGGSGVLNSNTKIHDNYLRYCGWGGPAYTSSQSAINTVVPYVKIYNNTIYYSGQCFELSAPYAELLNNHCEAKDDVTGAAMPYPTVSPQICLNFGSSTYGYWNMVAKGNVCKDYQNAGNASNSIGIMADIEIEDNTFINSQGFSLQGGQEGARRGWPGGNVPPTIHGTSYFMGNKFVFDTTYKATGNQGITLGSPREKWVIDHNDLLMPPNAGCGGNGCVALNLATGASFPAWQPSTTYTIDPNNMSVVQPPMPNGFWYADTGTHGTCTSGSSAPTFPITVGNTVVDNTCTWTNMGGKHVSVISNLHIAFPPGSTGGNYVIQNQGLLSSDIQFSNVTNEGNTLSGIEGIGYTANGWNLTGFPLEYWSHGDDATPSNTHQVIIRKGVPFGTSNRVAMSNNAFPVGEYYRAGDIVNLRTRPRGGGNRAFTSAGWKPKTWVASTFYPYNAMVGASPDNQHVFLATVACTSGNTQPTWDNGARSTTSDNAGGGTCVWKESGASAQFVLRSPN